MMFEEWLKKHKKAKTPLGDLARDFIDSNATTIEESFDKYSPCSDAWNTYESARRDYILELCCYLEDQLVRLIADKEVDRRMSEFIDTLRDMKDELHFIEAIESDE